MPSKGEKVRWAVIGATGIADRRAIPEGIIPAENSELVGVMATNAERVRKVAEKYGGVPWFTDARQMLEQVEADACYLACPPAVRLEYVQLCAEAGVHVFAEKPLARTVGEAEEMLEVCRQHGVKMGTAFMLPFHHLAQEATRLVQSGALGKVVSARAQFAFDYPPEPGVFRQVKALSEGGAFMDVGNHATDLLERILGSKVAAVTAVTANVVHQYEGVEDLCSALYRMENNALASVEASFCTDGARNEVEVTAHEKTLVLREMLGQGTGGVLSVVSGPYGQDLELEIESDGRNMYQGEITAFSEAILRDVEPPISGEDGLWSQRVVAAVYRSAESGCAKRP
jgi:predicted dehydrogenase